MHIAFNKGLCFRSKRNNFPGIHSDIHQYTFRCIPEELFLWTLWSTFGYILGIGNKPGIHGLWIPLIWGVKVLHLLFVLLFIAITETCSCLSIFCFIYLYQNEYDHLWHHQYLPVVCSLTLPPAIWLYYFHHYNTVTLLLYTKSCNTQ